MFPSLFYFTPYDVDTTCELLHNVTRRQIQMRMNLKWRDNIKDLSFSPFLHICQSNRPNKEKLKKLTFFSFDESSEKLKKVEKFLILTFS